MMRWNPTGSDNQKSIACEAMVERIKFPWERLTQLPGTPELGWRDLNPGMAMALDFSSLKAAEPEDHRAHGSDHHGEDKPHPFEVRLADGRLFTLGLIYIVSGRIYIDNRLEKHPTLAMEVIGMEGMHAVDLFLPMTDAQRNELMRMWNRGGTWWEVSSYQNEYFRLGGEAWMYEGLGAYSDFDLGASPFMHDAGVEPEDVRRILGIPRTDAKAPEPAPPPPVPEEPRPLKHFPGGQDIYHRAGHYGLSRGVPVTTLEGFRPCKVCKP